MFLLNLLLALAWVAVTGQFTPASFVVGFALSYFVLWLTQRTVGPSPYFGRVSRAVSFVLFFLWKVIQANLRVTAQILSPRPSLRPAVIAIPLDAQTDLEIVFLANLLTLTPGSLSLDVSNDRRVLYLHVIQVGDVDDERQDVKVTIERRLLELLR
jgi:multicomponent Na+:H+ antiporter subunit E